MHPKSVRYLNGLHAKVYLGDRAAIVGSANASATGTGWEGAEARGLVEAAVKVENDQTLKSIAAWMNRRWSAATEVTDADIKAARKIWRRRRATRPAAPGVSQTKNVFGRGILVVWDNLEQPTKREIAAFARWKSKRNGGSDWKFFTDERIGWIPENAKLLFVDTGKRSFSEGVWDTFDCVPFPLMTEPLGRTRFVIPVKSQRTVDLGGKPFPLTSDIRKRVWKYVQEHIAQNPKKKSGVVDLGDVLEAESES
jgi:hypothetical protein